MERTAKAVWVEAHDTALKRGFTPTDAVRHASQVALSYADRMNDAADDDRAERKLWGNG